MTWYHFSNNPIKMLYNVEQIDQSRNKPLGLWLSLNCEWIHCHDPYHYYYYTSYNTKHYIMCDNDPHICTGGYKYIYEIDITACNILYLKTYKDCLNFIKKYGRKYLGVINPYWKNISKDYDGICITNYKKIMKKTRYYKQLSWLYGYDLSSGCIWNTEKIKYTILKFDFSE